MKALSRIRVVGFFASRHLRRSHIFNFGKRIASFEPLNHHLSDNRAITYVSVVDEWLRQLLA